MQPETNPHEVLGAFITSRIPLISRYRVEERFRTVPLVKVRQALLSMVLSGYLERIPFSNGRIYYALTREGYEAWISRNNTKTLFSVIN